MKAFPVLRKRAKNSSFNLRSCEAFFDLDKKKKDLEALDKELSSPDIWEDQKKIQSLQQQKKSLERDINVDTRIIERKEELEVLLELIEEGENVEGDLSTTVSAFDQELSRFELHNLFIDADDARNVILTIHPGAGGTESQDWAQMLLRMYLRYAERKGFRTEILDTQPGEEAGLKSATIRIEGDYAYGNLSQESGVHRLVRISPFDANKRRHTSFAAVFIYPEIDEDIEIEINPEDLRIDTYRASGRGGQHVNVTDSAVRITHTPTGIVVQCQNERSQHKNKASALKVLKARLYELEKKQKREKLEKLEDAKGDIAWGNQIRSYVLHPYRMVKDLRTRVEIGNVDRVLDGDLDEFIKASLLERQNSKNSAQ